MNSLKSSFYKGDNFLVNSESYEIDLCSNRPLTFNLQALPMGPSSLVNVAMPHKLCSAFKK